MGSEYEIMYFILEDGYIHYAFADDLWGALKSMEECREETGSGCIVFKWRPANK